MIIQNLLQFSTVLLPFLSPDTTDSCRCLYGQSCWPSESEFSKLATRLTRPLLHPVPPASPCYPTSAPSSSCSGVITNFSNSQWRSDQPGAMQNTNFESFTSIDGTTSACYLDTSLKTPCGLGSIPPVGVDARTPSDVQVAVTFANIHNLKLVVKSTGHDFLGRSTARGSFLIWTHNLKYTTYYPFFIPEGSPATPENTFNAVTLGAGVQWHEAFRFVEQHGRFLVGSTPTVGAAGGWVMGGGYGLLSPSYGLGVDNVIQFTVVLADGSHVTTNAHQRPDLFWALRGGGGGTYGVVTSATYKTYAPVSVTRATINIEFPSPEIAQDVATEFIKFHPTFSDAGWSASMALSNSSLSGSLVAPGIAWEDASVGYFSFLRYAERATRGHLRLGMTTFNSFYDFYLTLLAEGETAGSQVEIASRLLPRSVVENDPAKVASRLLSVGEVHLNSVAGGAVSRPHPDSTGLNPAWRHALSEVVVAAEWADGPATPDSFLKLDGLKQSTLILDGLTTDSGSYLNEGSRHELDFKKSFFGSHYEELKSIKNKYDPTSLFVVPFGVGSDEWDGDLVCGHRA